jgi:hypothetical protein
VSGYLEWRNYLKDCNSNTDLILVGSVIIMVADVQYVYCHNVPVKDGLLLLLCVF